MKILFRGKKGSEMAWRRPLRILCIISALLCTTIPLHMVDDTYIRLKVQKKQRYLKGTVLHSVVFSSRKEQGAREVIKRKGIIAKRPNAKATILVCHGYMCNKDDTSLFRLIFPDYNVMTFDFRAHGEKVEEHHCCTFGKDEMYDVISAVNVIKSDLDLKNIPLIAYGFSMGAVASIQAQARDSSLFDAMILDCPYDKSENVIKRALSNTKITIFGYSFNIPGSSLLEKYAFHPYVQSFLKTVLKTVAHLDAHATNTRIYPVNPADSVKRVHIPCLFIHCRNDEKVPVDAVKLVYNGAQGFKRLWITAGRRHFDSFFYNPEKYTYKVNKFIESVLMDTIAKKVPAKVKEDVVV